MRLIQVLFQKLVSVKEIKIFIIQKKNRTKDYNNSIYAKAKLIKIYFQTSSNILLSRIKMKMIKNYKLMINGN